MQSQAQAMTITDCNRRITELEEELSRQRVRMMEVVAEKNAELEIVRNDLAISMCARAGVTKDRALSTEPSDPDPQPKSYHPTRQKSHKNSFEEAGSYEDSLVAPVRRSISQLGESRNVFYEQELIKREEEILQLRMSSRMAEFRTRDLEQSMLTKDIQYLQIVETLKEEIRILEGKLKMEITDTNMAYLRNIFVQFLNSPNATSRNHILKAIGAVLKLTTRETGE